MTIHNLKGVMGFKIEMIDLIKILLRIDPKGEHIKNIKETLKECEFSLEVIVENPLLIKDDEAFDDWMNDIESNLSGHWLSEKWTPYYLFEFENSSLPCTLGIYKFCHDQEEGEYTFTVGEELLEVKIDNGLPYDESGFLYKTSGARDKDKLDKVMKYIKKFSEVIDEDEIITKSNEIRKIIPEFSGNMKMFIIQDDCSCCS